MISKIAYIFVVLLSVAIYKFQSKYFPNQPCSSDPRPIFSLRDDGASWDSCHVFSLEYEEARSKFRQTTRDLQQAELFSLPVYDDLTMDIAILNGTKRGLIIHTIATHGVEGYAGSSIQLAFLQELKRSPEQERPTIVLVHAVNPYGMKHYRRANENNVDINRNAIDDFDKFRAKRDPNIAGYETFRELVSPSRAPTIWDLTLGYWISSLSKIGKVGFTRMKELIVAGQYHHPEGFSFGGTKLQPSIKVLTNFIKERGYDSGNVFWIDVHTGLGKFGKDTLIFERGDGMELQKWFKTSEHIVTPNVANKKALGGYDLVRGIVMSFLQGQNPTGIYVMQEFGTIPPIFVGRSLILEMMIYQYGKKSDMAFGRQLLQKSFYPQSFEWRTSIVQRGIAFLNEAIDYLDHQTLVS